MKLETTKERLQELAAINNPFLREDSMASSAASEALSMLAHPDLKKQIESLYDMQLPESRKQDARVEKLP